MLLVYFIVAAIPLGYLLGGRLSNYAHQPLKCIALPCLAFLIEASFGVLAERVAGPASRWLGPAVCLEYLLLAVFLWANRRRRGVKLMGLATACNLLVISANGFRMPVSPLIYDYPKYASLVERIRSGALPEYVLVDWDGPLWFLGDAIPIFGGLASVGDMLMGAGLVLLIVHLMRAKAAEAVPVDENGSERTE